MGEDANEVCRAAQPYREKKPLGILFLGGNSRNFEKDFSMIDIPCVPVTNDASGLPLPNLSGMSTDDRQAARDTIDILIALGTGILWWSTVTGLYRIPAARGRRGVSCFFRNHGTCFDEDKAYQGVRYSYQDGYNATRKLLAAGHRFAALFAAADVMAIGAIRALRDNGLRVPAALAPWVNAPTGLRIFCKQRDRTLPLSPTDCGDSPYQSSVCLGQNEGHRLCLMNPPPHGSFRNIRCSPS